jgi:hypothetical protein
VGIAAVPAAKPKPLGVLPTAQEDLDALLKKVMDIEQVVEQHPVIHPHYIDDRDAEWVNGATALEQCILQPSQLSPDEVSALEFGMRQARLLSEHWSLPKVTVAIASDLPAETIAGNAFRRSYKYDQPQNELYVRQARLAETGSFLMVILHAMAHIKVGNMENDQAPNFVEAFYDGLKHVCCQLVTTRSRVGDVSALVSEMAKETAAGTSRQDALRDLADLSI